MLKIFLEQNVIYFYTYILYFYFHYYIMKSNFVIQLNTGVFMCILCSSFQKKKLGSVLMIKSLNCVF